MIILIFGPPGSGKGTQSAMISRKFGIPVLSTGGMLRAIISDVESELGSRISKFVLNGELVPDDLMCALVAKAIENNSKGFILDGFPRTVSQAKFLVEKLMQIGLTVNFVFKLEINEDHLLERLKKRVMCRNCDSTYSHDSFSGSLNNAICPECGAKSISRRDDDINEAIILKRARDYEKSIKEVCEFFSDIRCINALDTVENVFSLICEKIEEC